MRIYNPQPTGALLPELRKLLALLRRRRGFEAERYIQAKVVVLNTYLREARLNACVLGVSGGVDSAVALGLAARARAQVDSPLQKIVAALMPIFDPGATHQGEAAAKGRDVAERFGVVPITVDLSAGHAALKTAVDSAMEVQGEPWASGQLVSYARTPALYYITSLLTQQGYRGLLLGTTNRDEGGYLGFIGKASDAMVDVQILSDLHKSEIYAVARALGVPDSILQATPTGDMYDARSDEEVFGAPYDFVELYLLWKDLKSAGEREALPRDWSSEAQAQFAFFGHNLEELHRYNRHKYIGKSPAVHLDILHASTPGGWNNSLYLAHPDPVVDTARINGFFALDEAVATALLQASDPEIEREELPDLNGLALHLHGVLRAEEAASLCGTVAEIDWVPVGISGKRQEYRPETDAIGSWRATTCNPTFARMLWNRIGRLLGSPRILDSKTPTDGDGTPVWRAVGINPLLRLIRYRHDGALLPHYDAPFIYHEGKRTLVSVILYLDMGGNAGGATRFVSDPQADLPVPERDLDDWPRFATDAEIRYRVRAKAGDCLVFDHRILHDAEAYVGSGHKLILRTDVVFERCGTAPADV
jgi:NAD+ synthetase